MRYICRLLEVMTGDDWSPSLASLVLFLLGVVFFSGYQFYATADMSMTPKETNLVIAKEPK